MKKIPKLCHWKKRGLAYVYQNNRKIYLGPWGSPEAQNAYLALCNRILDEVHDVDVSRDYTVSEVILAFFDARAGYYVKNGKQTGQLDRFRTSVEYVLAFYPDLPARLFGPKKLIECRSAMEKSGRFSRGYLNTLVNCIRHIFKYAVESELVQPDVLVALQSVGPLKRGRSVARETSRTLPVSAADVEKTLPELSPVVAAMVAVQRYTGMRPGEVCAMRVGDFAFSDEVLIYTLRGDKTDWRRAVGDLKRVPIGPKAQGVLFPYLLEKEGDPDAYLFTPEDAMRDLALARRENRKTPITGQTRRRDAAEKTQRFEPCYNTDSYRRAITRACKRAGVPHWAPNQLRHLYASEIRAKYGLEEAQVMLGHANANVTQIYAERDFVKACQIALKEG